MGMRLDSTPYFVSRFASPVNLMWTQSAPLHTQHFLFSRATRGFVCSAKLSQHAGKRTAWIHVAPPHSQSSFSAAPGDFESLLVALETRFALGNVFVDTNSWVATIKRPVIKYLRIYCREFFILFLFFLSSERIRQRTLNKKDLHRSEQCSD